MAESVNIIIPSTLNIKLGKFRMMFTVDIEQMSRVLAAGSDINIAVNVRYFQRAYIKISVLAK